MTPLLWTIIVIVAILIGLDKSLLPGAGILGVALLATMVPAKEATGTTLALILVADWTAIWAYRKNVDWATLRRLMPNVVIGVTIGAGFLFLADDEVTKRTIGVILVIFIAVNLFTMYRAQRRAKLVTASISVTGVPAAAATGSEPPASSPRQPFVKRLVYGAMAGFTTMVANAGGPVTSMYFLSEGFPVMKFLGTTAWFYLIINLVKLPFSIGLGMIQLSTLWIVLAMTPVIVLTVFCGRYLAKRINRSLFNTLIIILTIITAVQLLF